MTGSVNEDVVYVGICVTGLYNGVKIVFPVRYELNIKIMHPRLRIS